MIICRCIEKFRDQNGNIKGYRLQDKQGKYLDIKSDQLKLSMLSQQIDVVNLKLTTDNKLINKEENNSVSSQRAAITSHEEEILNKLLKLIKQNSSESWSEDSGESWRWEESLVSQAVELFEQLGVKIEKVELPSKKYLDYTDPGARYYCGSSKIDFFRDSGLAMLTVVGNEKDSLISSPNNITELKYIVDFLKSDENTKCISYGQIHKMCTKAMLHAIKTEDRLKDYLISIDWDGFVYEFLYCTPVKQADFNEGYYAFSITINSVCEKPNCYNIYIFDDLNRLLDIYVDIYTCDLKQVYIKIQKVIKTVVENM